VPFQARQEVASSRLDVRMGDAPTAPNTVSGLAGTVRRPVPVGDHRVVPAAGLHDVGVDAVSLGSIVDYILEGKSNHIVRTERRRSYLFSVGRTRVRLEP